MLAYWKVILCLVILLVANAVCDTADEDTSHDYESTEEQEETDAPLSPDRILDSTTPENEAAVEHHHEDPLPSYVNPDVNPSDPQIHPHEHHVHVDNELPHVRQDSEQIPTFETITAETTTAETTTAETTTDETTTAETTTAETTTAETTTAETSTAETSTAIFDNHIQFSHPSDSTQYPLHTDLPESSNTESVLQETRAHDDDNEHQINGVHESLTTTVSIVGSVVSSTFYSSSLLDTSEVTFNENHHLSFISVSPYEVHPTQALPEIVTPELETGSLEHHEEASEHSPGESFESPTSLSNPELLTSTNEDHHHHIHELSLGVSSYKTDTESYISSVSLHGMESRDSGMTEFEPPHSPEIISTHSSGSANVETEFQNEVFLTSSESIRESIHHLPDVHLQTSPTEEATYRHPTETTTAETLSTFPEHWIFNIQSSHSETATIQQQTTVEYAESSSHHVALASSYDHATITNTAYESYLFLSSSSDVSHVHVDPSREELHISSESTTIVPFIECPGCGPHGESQTSVNHFESSSLLHSSSFIDDLTFSHLTFHLISTPLSLVSGGFTTEPSRTTFQLSPLTDSFSTQPPHSAFSQEIVTDLWQSTTTVPLSSVEYVADTPSMGVAIISYSLSTIDALHLIDTQTISNYETLHKAETHTISINDTVIAHTPSMNDTLHLQETHTISIIDTMHIIGTHTTFTDATTLVTETHTRSINDTTFLTEAHTSSTYEIPSASTESPSQFIVHESSSTQSSSSTEEYTLLLPSLYLSAISSTLFHVISTERHFSASLSHSATPPTTAVLHHSSSELLPSPVASFTSDLLPAPTTSSELNQESSHLGHITPTPIRTSYTHISHTVSYTTTFPEVSSSSTADSEASSPHTHPLSSSTTTPSTTYNITTTPSTTTLTSENLSDFNILIHFYGDCNTISEKRFSGILKAKILLFISNIPHFKSKTKIGVGPVQCNPNKIKLMFSKSNKKFVFLLLNNTFNCECCNCYSTHLRVHSMILNLTGFHEALEVPKSLTGDEVTPADITVIAIASCICVVLVIAGTVICAREAYRKKVSKRFISCRSSRAVLKAETVALTRIPGQNSDYTDTEMNEERCINEAYNHSIDDDYSTLSTDNKTTFLSSEHSSPGSNRNEKQPTKEQRQNINDSRNSTMSESNGTSTKESPGYGLIIGLMGYTKRLERQQKHQLQQHQHNKKQIDDNSHYAVPQRQARTSQPPSLSATEEPTHPPISQPSQSPVDSLPVEEPSLQPPRHLRALPKSEDVSNSRQKLLPIRGDLGEHASNTRSRDGIDNLVFSDETTNADVNSTQVFRL